MRLTFAAGRVAQIKDSSRILNGAENALQGWSASKARRANSASRGILGGCYEAAA